MASDGKTACRIAAALASVWLALPCLGSGELVVWNHVKDLDARDAASAGRDCTIRGVVTHISGLKERFFVLADSNYPYRGGIPVSLRTSFTHIITVFDLLRRVSR